MARDDSQGIRTHGKIDYQPRVKIDSTTGCMMDTIVTVGGQRLTNVVKVEFTIDANVGYSTAVLHLIDVDVDVDVFDGETVVVLNEVDRG